MADAMKLGDQHTAIMDAIHGDLLRQNPGAFVEEDGNATLVIPTKPFLTIDVSSLAEAVLPALRNRTSEPEAGAVANDNPLTFGMGALVVNTGKFGGDNAVFIAKATAPGEVGAYTGNSAFDRHTLQPGELVMIFPTEERVQAVADALVGPHPAPATADKLLVAKEGLGLAQDYIKALIGDPRKHPDGLSESDAEACEVLDLLDRHLAALNEGGK